MSILRLEFLTVFINLKIRESSFDKNSKKKVSLKILVKPTKQYRFYIENVCEIE